MLNATTTQKISFWPVDNWVFTQVGYSSQSTSWSNPNKTTFKFIGEISSVTPTTFILNSANTFIPTYWSHLQLIAARNYQTVSSLVDLPIITHSSHHFTSTKNHLHQTLQCIHSLSNKPIQIASCKSIPEHTRNHKKHVLHYTMIDRRHSNHKYRFSYPNRFRSKLSYGSKRKVYPTNYLHNLIAIWHDCSVELKKCEKLFQANGYLINDTHQF